MKRAVVEPRAADISRANEPPQAAVVVLVVSDDPALLHALMAVAPDRFDVEVASCVVDALAVMAARPVDCVLLLDPSFRDATGTTSLLAISTQFPGVAVIGITTDYDDDAADAAVRAGAQNIIAWADVTEAMLERMVRQAVIRHRGRVESQRIRAELAAEIHEREHAQEDLRSAARREQALIANASDMIVILDAGGLIQYASPASRRIMGWEPGETLGTIGADLVHPDDQPAVADAFAKTLATPGVQSPIVRRLRRSDGTWADTEVVINNCLHDPAIAGLVLTVRDVTEREQDRQALRRERDLGAAVLAAISEGYVFVAGDRISDVNQQLCDLTGFTRDQLLGSTRPYPFWAPEDHEALTEVSTSLRAAGAGRSEVTFCRADGTRFPAALSVRSAPDITGSVLGYVITIRDITDVKQREADLVELAKRDPLTGLLNRRAVDELFENLEPGDVVAIVDLDLFKAINDNHGHATGDRVLKSFAHCITTTLRPDDWAGRIGGEEFIIVAHLGQQPGAASVLSRLRASWDATEPLTTFSAGVAVHPAGTEPRQTLARADEALYEAKTAGRNRTLFR
jgi:diguanylate cyclase (GGDEF)-like protein/PAS domain S-box-containing protein